jgi:preprotein translocase subunit SecE
MGLPVGFLNIGVYGFVDGAENQGSTNPLNKKGEYQRGANRLYEMVTWGCVEEARRYLLVTALVILCFMLYFL